MSLEALAQYGAVGLLLIVAFLFRDHPRHGWATRVALPLGIVAALVLAGLEVRKSWIEREPRTSTVEVTPEDGWVAFSRSTWEPVAVTAHVKPEGTAIPLAEEMSAEALEQRELDFYFDEARLDLTLRGIPQGHVPVRRLNEAGWTRNDVLLPIAHYIRGPLRLGQTAALRDDVQVTVRGWNYARQGTEAGALVKVDWGSGYRSCDLYRDRWAHYAQPGEFNLYFQLLALNQEVRGEEQLTLLVLEYPHEHVTEAVSCGA